MVKKSSTTKSTTHGHERRKRALQDTDEFVTPPISPADEATHDRGNAAHKLDQQIARRSGDLDEETLDRSAPFNKSYGVDGIDEVEAARDKTAQ